jgi:5-formyltetrahydrofolate cyclo-ligase
VRPAGGLRSLTVPHDPIFDPTAPDAKAAMRRMVLIRRRQTHAARNTSAPMDLCDRVAAALNPRGKLIAGYWPLGDEIDPRPALIALGEAGGLMALPAVAGQGMVLIFRGWRDGDVLESGPFGTAHPPSRAPLVEPDTLLLPLIAFDAVGNRLGYGAGYYDRTVAALRRQRKMLVIGLAYDEQEVPEVPAAPHDQRLDGIITDRRTLWFES